MEMLQTILIIILIITLYSILLAFCLRSNRIDKIINTRIPSIINKYEKEIEFYNSIIFYGIMLFLICSGIFMFTIQN